MLSSDAIASSGVLFEEIFPGVDGSNGECGKQSPSKELCVVDLWMSGCVHEKTQDKNADGAKDDNVRVE